MTRLVDLCAGNTPVIFDTVRKWRSFCADTALDTPLFTHGSSDVRILVRSVLASVRHRGPSVGETLECVLWNNCRERATCCVLACFYAGR